MDEDEDPILASELADEATTPQAPWGRNELDRSAPRAYRTASFALEMPPAGGLALRLSNGVPVICRRLPFLSRAMPGAQPFAVLPTK